jgi:hypothetical protein
LIQYLIPLLSKEDFDAALRKAGLVIGERRGTAIRRRLSIALANYTFDHLAREDLYVPSQVRKRLRQLEGAAANADKNKCDRLMCDSAYGPAMTDVMRMAKISGLSEPEVKSDLGRLRKLAHAAGARLDTRIKHAKERAITH